MVGLSPMDARNCVACHGCPGRALSDAAMTRSNIRGFAGNGTSASYDASSLVGVARPCPVATPVAATRAALSNRCSSRGRPSRPGLFLELHRREPADAVVERDRILYLLSKLASLGVRF